MRTTTRCSSCGEDVWTDSPACGSCGAVQVGVPAAATKKCPFCAEEVQAAAVRCKHCQADLTPKQPAARPVFAVLGALFLGLPVVGVMIANAVGDPGPTHAAAPTVDTKKDMEITAWVVAQDFVKRRLKSPGSADFGSLLNGSYQSPSDHVRDLGGGRWEAHGWVDSQNGFGALLRSNFRVTMERGPDGTWTAIDGPTLGEN